tara:strand:+ start:189 stop:614 length:426 start_codon:yes stop_codon:yes gene_type:complete
MKNNKLIAEFMGVNIITIDDVRKNKNPYISSADGYLEDDLKYHSSWDWLIPTIQKCLVGEAEQSEEISNTLIKNIYEGIFNQDISFAHKSVIQFIKTYKTEVLISKLKSADLDGETTQYILEQIGMDYQMYKQLNVKYNNK